MVTLTPLAPRQCDPAQGQVVGLGATGGDDDLAGQAAQHAGDLLVRFTQGLARLPAKAVQAARIAVVFTEIGQHRLQHLRANRGGGGVVEVDGFWHGAWP